MANAPNPKQMAGMSWDDLYEMRLRPEFKDRQSQNLISPYEHRAYAREAVRDNLGMAPMMALMVPGYQAYKGMTSKSRSAPSMDQLQQGLLGAGEGMVLNLSDIPDRMKRGLLSMF